MSGPRLKIPLVLVAAVILHTAVLSNIKIEGVRPDLMLLVAVCAGLAGGPERGALVGFGAGLLADVFLQTPLGLSAFTFTVVAFGVGTIQTSIMRAAFWIPPLTALFASALGVALYVLTGAVVGQTQLVRPDVLIVMGLVAVLNVPLSPMAFRVVSWAMEGGAE